jgi:hypothetical protein
VVGDELEVFEVDGLVLGELDVKQEDIASGNSGFTWIMEPSNRLEEKHVANPPSWSANCRCVLHQKIQGGQDRAFLF